MKRKIVFTKEFMKISLGEQMLFPLEIGYPKRRLVWDENTFLNIINFFNGKTHVFRSVYSYPLLKENEKLEYETHALVNKIFFDFDGENSLEDTIKFHDYLLKNNHLHTVLFSGMKGFHVYLYVPKTLYHNSNHNSKREFIGSIQLHFADKLGIQTDEHIIGNVAQMARIPNTIHPKSKKMCTFLCEEDLSLSFSEIKEKSTKITGMTVFGRKTFDETVTSNKKRYKTYMPEINFDFDADKLINTNENTAEGIKTGITPTPFALKS